MFIQGIFSLMHAWFLPGFLILFFFSKFKNIEKILFAVPLSLLINYLLVNFLIILKIFDYLVINLILVCEVILILYIFFKKNINLSIIVKKKVNLNFDIIDLLNLIIFLIYLYLGVNSLGGTIPLGDGVVNFHSWAVELYNQKIPNTWGWYTLGIPSSQAFIYKAINNNEIQFFTQAFFFIYPSLNFFIFYRISYFFKTNKIKYDLLRIGCLFSGLLILNVFRNYALHVGYVDPILCVYTTFCIYIFIYLIKNKKIDFQKIIFLFLIIALGFLIKPNGIYNSILFFISLIFFFKNNNFKLKIFSYFLIIHFIIIGPTFVYKFINIFFFDAPDVSMSLIKIYNVSLIKKLQNSIPYAFGIFSIFLPFLFFLKNEKLLLKILLFYFLPWFLIWTLLFQYDNRNLVFVFPVFAICLAKGIQNFLIYLSKYNILKNYDFCKKLFLLLICFSFLFIIQFKRTEIILTQRDIIAKMKRGSSETNALLYNYLSEVYDSSVVYTSTNNEFEYLPKIGKIFIYKPCSNDIDKNIHVSNQNIIKNIFFLMRVGDPGCTKELLSFFKKNYEQIFVDMLNNYYLFKIENIKK